MTSRAVTTRTLITGMSATGKSSTVLGLAARGHRAVDLDADGWSEHVADDSEWAGDDPDATDWRWRETRVRGLLEEPGGTLFVAGTSSNQGTFYGLLDHVVLLTVPTEVALHRLGTRTTNEYGKAPDELHRELELREVVEPLLMAGACLVLDTSLTAADDVVAQVIEHARQPGCRA